jgi:rhodanese-related sulfurtransferase
MKAICEALIIIVIAIVVGLIVNATRNMAGFNGLAFNTPWPDNRQRLELEFPPSFDEGDSLISIDDAYNHFLEGDVIFIDAREEEEYDEGHIAGALVLPFDFWDDYWDLVQPELDTEKHIIVYCGGLDCELSLFAVRELKYLGYDKAYTFFGGWVKWVEAGLPIEITEYED